MTPAVKPLEVRAIQTFLTSVTSMPQMSSENTQRVCATLQALAWRIQQSSKIEVKATIEQTFVREDLLGCRHETEFKTLDSLMRSEHRVVKSFTFSLLNTLASY